MKAIKHGHARVNVSEMGLLQPFGDGTDPRALSFYADAYYEAGLRQAKHLGKGLAFDILPCVFLIRHAVEINLKSMIWALRKAAEMAGDKIEPNGAETEHDLRALLEVVQRHDSHLLPACYEELVKMLDEIDRSSFEFRYTTQKKSGAPTFSMSKSFSIPKLLKLAKDAKTTVFGAVDAILVPAEDFAAESW